jgi:hypothetical protein
MSRLIAIIFLIPTLAFSQDAKKSEYIRECIESFKVMEDYLVRMGISIEERCAAYKKTDLAWISSGKLVVFVRKEECEFMGKIDQSPNECLPR